MNYKTFSVGQDGRYRFNKIALRIKPYFLVPDNSSLNSSNPEEIEMVASSSSAEMPIYTVEDGGFEITHLSCYRTAACTIEMTDNTRKQKITGRPCHVDTIFGDGQEPFVLSESLFLRKNQAILFKATDLSAATNDIRPVFAGQRIMADLIREPNIEKYIEERDVRSRFVLPYLCPLDEDPAPTTSQEKEYYFTQQSIAHFEVRKITFASTGVFKFRVTDETGNRLTSDWVHSSAVGGTAMQPYVLPTPWVIQAGGKVRFTIKDLGAVSTNYIYLTLCGRSLFVAGR